jgi:hypothetical protein
MISHLHKNQGDDDILPRLEEYYQDIPTEENEAGR